MKKLLIIVVFVAVGYYIFIKPKKDEEFAINRLAEIEEELLSITDIDNKILYLTQLVNSESNTIVIKELQTKIQQFKTVKIVQETAGNSNTITVGGINFTYTDAQKKKIADALARIKTDFNEWLNSHYDTIDVYENVANSWSEDEVIKLIEDWDSKRKRSLYEAAMKQNWTYGSTWWKKEKKQRMTLVADQFKLRIKNVTNKYF
jgi:hypothetical protein